MKWANDLINFEFLKTIFLLWELIPANLFYVKIAKTKLKIDIKKKTIPKIKNIVTNP